jgi:nicotinamide phosphoribosyltransferase
MKGMQAMLMADFYKISHREQYPPGTEKVYSTWTPRSTRVPGVNRVVVFGVQGFCKEFLVDFFNENFFHIPLPEVIGAYRRIIRNTLGIMDPHVDHIAALHELGYLPLRVRSLPEGSIAPMRCPTLTIENTNPKFAWVTNFIESVASTYLWLPSTSATIANEYRKLLESYAMKTVGNTDFVPFQGHDFSFRGMGSWEAAARSGAAHLLSFVGTDTIPAINYHETYYGADVTKELVGTSIPATEHSVECAYGDDMAYFRRLINEVYPKGFVSIVSDGYDFWDVIGRVLPALKGEIMARDGKVVIRPDSGDPVKILCGDPNAATGTLEEAGLVEALWNLFGGTVSPQGYKVLDPHIGCIYGDSISLERARAICEVLEAKGFASVNVVYGIGSFTYQFNTRDTFGFALKSTLCVIDGKEVQIYKAPKTDDGTKNSQKGRVAVFAAGDSFRWTDGHSLKDHLPGNQLQDVFFDGQILHEQSLSEIRRRIRGLNLEQSIGGVVIKPAVVE